MPRRKNVPAIEMKDSPMSKIAPCLWFDGKAEVNRLWDALRYGVSDQARHPSARNRLSRRGETACIGPTYETMNKEKQERDDAHLA